MASRGACGLVASCPPASARRHDRAMLSPYRVLDLTDDRGHLAGFLLGQLGADVILVEPPEGSSARAGPFVGDEPG